MTGLAGAGQVAHQFRLLIDDVTDSNDIKNAAHQLTVLATRTIAGCDWAGLTRHSTRHGIHTAAASARTTLQVDQLQYGLHEGPCVDAVTTEGHYHAPDLTADTRWPRFSVRTVADTPVRSVLSVTLSPAPPRTALNLYSPRVDAFGPDAVGLATVFADHAAVLLRHLQAIDRMTNLERALATSRLIGTAVGVLTYRYKITTDEALRLLVHTSQHRNRKLTDIADGVTATGELPTP